MSFPLIFDIALGLLFIFLTLSLLASEIQELITTILQWRAEHLKKSIENLIFGGGEKDTIHYEFVEELYRSPLIKALNQEAKGLLPQFFRGIIHGLGAAYRGVSGTPETFGGRSTGPSYIPAQTFAEALLQKLKLDTVAQKTSELTLKQFCREKLTLIDRILQSLRHSVGDDSLLEIEFDGLRRQLIEITKDFRGNRISLSKAMDEAIAQLSYFLDNTEAFLNHNNLNQDIIRARLPFLRQAVLQRKPEPTIYEVLVLLIEEEGEVPGDIADIVQDLRQQLQALPPELRQNMLALAEQAQGKVGSLSDGVRQLKFEVESWFDRSMDRASGVYRRNAKGVAITLGLLTAILTNSDAFLMIDRLAQDTSMRSAITQTTNQLVAQQFQVAGETIPTDAIPAPPLNGDFATDSTAALSPEQRASAKDLQTNLITVREALSNVLGELPLPIGWSQENLARQFPPNISRFIVIPKLLAGWLVTGIAISMGANFWFDLLGKIVRVRNTGGSGKPSATD